MVKGCGVVLGAGCLQLSFLPRSRSPTVFVIGRQVRVKTDHRSNLHVALAPHNLNFFKLARWIDELQEFDLEWSYTPGEANGLPDWLSRMQEMADRALAAPPVV